MCVGFNNHEKAMFEALYNEKMKFPSKPRWLLSFKPPEIWW